MNRHQPALVLLAVSILYLTGCAGDGHHSAGHGQAHWSYEGDTGPAHWGSLDPAWVVADHGGTQSPIDIDTGRAVRAELPPLDLVSLPGTVSVVDNGHTVQWNVADGCRMSLEGRDFGLKQFHFHAPSEHTINAGYFPVELHFVHADEQGNLAVIGVMVGQGGSNAVYRPVVSSLHQLASEHGGHGDHAEGHEGGAGPAFELDPYALFPQDRSYYAYPGSLTTPPCAEGVRWHVLRRPVELSAKQVEAFTRAYTGNNRPVQPVNGRHVLVNE